MPDIAEQIAKPDPLTTLRALVDAQVKATPGPWTAERRWSNGCEVVPRITCQPDSERGCGWIADAVGAPYLGHHRTLPNAAFIAACGSADFAALLRAFEELQRENAKLKNKIAEIECQVCGDDPHFCGHRKGREA